MNPKIAIIGGSGLYSLNSIKKTEKKRIETPYGTSPGIVVGEFEGKKLAFLPRHGEGHTTPPHKINFRANLWSLKELGIERILATTAVGSLRKEFEPGKLIILDQFLDFTKNREKTFYEGNGEKVVHVDMTNPYCPELRKILIEIGKKRGIPIEEKGTYACTEGPRFETAAEIKMLKKMEADVVGMTNVPESVLARELEMCYSTISVVTNYAAGISADKLTHKEVAEIMDKNIKKVQNLIFSSIPEISEERKCPCKDALSGATVEP